LSFIALSTELTKLHCFLSWQSGSFDVIKIVSITSIQDSTNTGNVNTF